MELIRFSLWNLWKKPKDAAFFAIAIVATASIITIFFSIINDPYYGQILDSSENYTSSENLNVCDEYGNLLQAYPQPVPIFDSFERGIGDGVFTVMLSLVIIGICILVIFFANKFFLLGKSKDVGIMVVSGNPITRVVKFFMVQNYAIIFVCAPIGAFLGLAFTPLMNHFIYSALQLDASIFTFTPISAVQSFITLCIVGLWLVLVDAGYVYRFCNLVDLLKADRRVKATLKPRLIILLFAYVAAYITGLGLFYTFPLQYVIFLFMFYVGFFVYFGYMNIFRYVLPVILTWVRKRICEGSKLYSIAIGNLQYSIKESSHLAMIILLSTSILLYYGGKMYEDKGTLATIMVAYCACLLLVCFCFVYKILVDSMSKEAIFLNMQRVGYVKVDIRSVIRFEVSWFYFFFIILSIPQFLAIGLAYVRDGLVPLSFVLSFIFVFVGALIITGIVSNIAYQKIIFKKAKERSLARE